MPAISGNAQKTALLAASINHILVVEDQPVAAEVVKQILTDLNCNVDIATNGLNAVALTKQKHYDLIFMDIGLPDIDGYEVTKQIRLSENFSTHRTPIIALTAHADLESKEFCLTVGMNAVLTKPLMKKQALQILEVFLSNYTKNTADSTTNIALPTLTEEAVNYKIAKAILGQDEIIKKVLMMLENSLAEEKNSLDNAYTKKDWKKIQEIAHKFSGGASYCRALRLKEACSMLKECIAKGNLELSESYYQKMREEMQAFAQYVSDSHL